MVASVFSQTTVSSPSGAQALATQIVAAGQGSVLVYNTDSVNTVWLGPDNSILATDQSDVSPLGPGGSIVFDGNINVYAATAAGIAVILNIYPDAVNFTPSVQITPLVSEGAYGGTPPAFTIAAGAISSIFTLIPVSQYSSYDINVYFHDTTGDANTVQVLLQWYDDLVSGIPVFEEDWWLWVSRQSLPTTNLLSNPMAGNGPMHGRYMSVSIYNPNPTSTVTCDYLNIFGSNRTVPYSDWRQNMQLVFPKINGAFIIQGTEGTAFDNHLTVGNNLAYGGVNINYVPIGLYAGPIAVRFQSNTALSNALVIASMVGNLNNTAIAAGTSCPNVVYNGGTNSEPASFETEVNLIAARAPYIIVWKSAAAGNVSFSVQAQQAA